MWIQTFGGRAFYPMKPRAGDIDIVDIAHSLSLQCRFNGHCRTFYSVAEHAVRVSRICPEGFELWGLLHDAAEAYISDIPRPVKQQLPAFSAAEDRILQMVMKKWKLPWPMPPQVALADDTLLVTEARDLLGKTPIPWKMPIKPLAGRIVPVSPARAKRMFLQRFEQLTR